MTDGIFERPATEYRTPPSKSASPLHRQYQGGTSYKAPAATVSPARCSESHSSCTDRVQLKTKPRQAPTVKPQQAQDPKAQAAEKSCAQLSKDKRASQTIY